MAYNFTTEWVKGTSNSAPDTLSRHPVEDPQPEDMLAEHDCDSDVEVSIAEIRTMSSGTQESIRLQDLRKYAQEDHCYQQLSRYISEGFPDHRKYVILANLSVISEPIVFGQQLDHLWMFG